LASNHDVDSSESRVQDRRLDGPAQTCFQQAKPALLEPIVTLHITAPPSDKLGDITSDLSGPARAAWPAWNRPAAICKP